MNVHHVLHLFAISLSILDPKWQQKLDIFSIWSLQENLNSYVLEILAGLIDIMLGSFVQNIYKFVSLPKSKRGTAYYSKICFTHKSKLKFIQAPLEIQKFYHILTFFAAVKYICMKLKSYLELHVADWYKIENFTFWSLFCPISAVVTWHIDTTWSLLTVESATMNKILYY